MRNLLSNKWLTYLLFSIVFGYYSFDLGLNELLLKRPSGIHQWRQTDGASLTLTYFQDENSFWKPKIHNQLGQDGSAGGEFPILYYFTSKLYHLFGPHEWMLRLVHFSCFFFGLLMFLSLAQTETKSPFWGVLILMLAIASPTIMFYSINYLPDTPAFGLALAGSVFLLKYWKNKRPIYLRLALVFTLLGGLIKISMLLPVIAILGARVLISFFERKDFGKTLLYSLVIGIVIIIPIAAWYLYIASYNEANHGTYFTTKITPLWKIPTAELDLITERFFKDWLDLVFPNWLLYSIFISIVLFGVLWTKIDSLLKWSTVLMVLGAILYIPMFYIAFAHHDYYFITLFLPIFFLFVSVASAFTKLNFKPLLANGLILVFTIICWQASAEAVQSYKRSYGGWFRDFSIGESFNDLESFLDANGIGYDKKVYLTHDESPNRGLYLMNRKGWTKLSGVYNSDNLDSLIVRGAEYVVVRDTSFNSVNFIKYHISDTIGYHNEIGVFRLKPSS